MKSILIILLTSLYAISSVCQTDEHKDHDHTEHKHEHHNEHKWDLGIALGAVPLPDENKIAPGLHIHLLRNMKQAEKIQLGIGFESVVDEHTHLNTGFVFNYNVIKGLYAGFSPGVLFLKHEEEWNTAFSSHFELAYVFDFSRMHLGPVIEYSYSSLEQHYMFGVHLGIGF